MKKILLSLPVALMAFNAYSGVYVNAGIGASSFSHDERVVFSGSSNVTLTPRDADYSWRLGVGYRQEQSNWGLEFGYSHFDADSSREQLLSAGIVNNQFVTVTNKWEADIKVNQLSLKPVYFYDLNQDVSLNVGLGLTYTNYDVRGNSFEETDREPSDFDTVRPIAGSIFTARTRKHEIGAIASVGVDYSVWNNVTIGAQANISADKVSRIGQVFANVGYRF